VLTTLHVACGSKPEVPTPTRHFRSTPDSRHRYADRSGRFRARNGSEATRAYGSASRGDNLFDPCQPRILFRADPVVASKRWRPLDLENTALSGRVAFMGAPALPSLRSAMLRVISFQPAGVLACRWCLRALTVRGRQKPGAHQPFNPRSRKMNFCSLPEAACGKCETKRQKCGTLW
jgi:hypothetical protein